MPSTNPNLLPQPRTYRLALIVEHKDLHDAVEAEISARAGGSAQAQTSGTHDDHLADIVREALRAHLLASPAAG